MWPAGGHISVQCARLYDAPDTIKTVITILTGPNDFLIKQTLTDMVNHFVTTFGEHAIERVSGEELAPNRLSELLQGASLFAAERLVILRDAALNKPLWEALGDWVERIPAETTLVIVEPVLDKRTRTYKQLVKHGDFRVFEEPTEKALETWMMRVATEAGGRIEPKAAQYLIRRIGVSQWRAWQELQKLLAHNPVIDEQAITLLVEPNPQVTVFEVLDAVLDRKASVARELLKGLAADEDPYKFFGLLVAQVHALAIAKHAGTRSAESIAKEAGVHPFVVRKSQTLARTTSPEALKILIDTVVRCDIQLKSTGADPWFLLGQCLNKIASQ